MPADDICELKYFDIPPIGADMVQFYELNIVEEHRFLLDKALKYAVKKGEVK